MPVSYNNYYTTSATRLIYNLSLLFLFEKVNLSASVMFFKYIWKKLSSYLLL